MDMADQFTIDIVRGNDYGMLKFDYEPLNVRIYTKCWWDPANKVDAGTYIGAATRMTNKKDGFDGMPEAPTNREAIYLGSNVPCNSGVRRCNGIFIHKGYSARESQGCILADKWEVLKIWQCINPKDLYFVMINVLDQP